jgi:hypothetical protein
MAAPLLNFVSGVLRSWRPLIAALGVAVPTLPNALAQPDPFRSSSPQAARPARDIPLETRPTAPGNEPPAGRFWAIDMSTGCQIALRLQYANAGVVFWYGECVNQRAHGLGTLTVYANGSQEIHCDAVMRNGVVQGRSACD